MRLIQKQKGRYFLKNNDTDSIDYKLALFSCFSFYQEENAKLFELKMSRWEELKAEKANGNFAYNGAGENR